MTAPVAGTALVTITPAAGFSVRVYGWAVGSENDANFIQLREAATVRLGFGIDGGSAFFLSPMPISVPAVNTTVSLNNLNGGAAGRDYSASILYELV